MQHPGPPRFVATGDGIEVAPRDPDPDVTYRWSVRSAPTGSKATVGDDPVEWFTPDRPGRYTLELSTATGTDHLTVCAFDAAYDATDVAGGSGEAVVEGGGPDTGAKPDSIQASGPYAAPVETDQSGGGRPRVRLDATVENEEVRVRATPNPHPDSVRSSELLGVEFVLDDRDVETGNPCGTVRDRVGSADHELRIPVDAIGDRLRVHGVAVRPATAEDPSVRFSVADVVSIERTGTSFVVNRPNDPPEWALDTTVYEIYVREFNDDGDEQTTFDAIAGRLPYLADLGVETLWLTPVLQHDGAPHGYNITDFFDVASDLGERADYETFVDRAHEHGIRVLFDFVANHTARDHAWFQAAYEDPESPYRDRYEWMASGEPGTYFDWELIANLNHSDLAVRRHLLDAVDEWAPLVDGFRCDMAWAVPDSFWRELRDRTKAMDETFLLLDETIPYIADFHEGMFDVHFDTTLYFTLRQIGRGDAPAEELLDAVQERTRVGFPDFAEFLLYMENHDETRYVVECGDAATRAAAGALFTLPGVPMIYAGQEIGQRGRRDTIAWDHAREDFQDHYKRLIALQDEHPALGHVGDIEGVAIEAAAGGSVTDPNPQDRLEFNSGDVVAYRRWTEDNELLVVLNFGATPAAVDVDLPVQGKDLVTGEGVLIDDGPGDDRVLVEDVVVLQLAR